MSVATFSVDDLGDFLIERGILANVVTAFTGKLECIYKLLCVPLRCWPLATIILVMNEYVTQYYDSHYRAYCVCNIIQHLFIKKSSILLCF